MLRASKSDVYFSNDVMFVDMIYSCMLSGKLRMGSISYINECAHRMLSGKFWSHLATTVKWDVHGCPTWTNLG